MRKLEKIDKKEIPNNRSEVRCFCVGRNEGKRLPFFIKYHKELGVDRFFYVDNNSSDDSIEFLLGQDDVHVWKTDQSYQESRYGYDWQEALLKKYGVEQWCLLLDADEFFFFPYSDKGVPIQDFVTYLEKERARVVTSMMLDMYSDKSIKDTHLRKNEDLFSICPFFDAPKDVKSFFRTKPQKSSHAIHLKGEGVRSRVFSTYACMRKFVFIKYDEKWTSKILHFFEEEGKSSSVRTILFHFKFLDNFSNYVQESVKRNCHWNDSSEYKAYMTKLKKEPNLYLYDKDISARFRGTKDLIERNILTYVNYAENPRKSVLDYVRYFFENRFIKIVRKLLNRNQRKILTTTGRMDGFGSQYSAIISGLAYCRYHDYIYRHTPFRSPRRKAAYWFDADEGNKFVGFKSDQDDDSGREVDIIEKDVYEPFRQDYHCFFTMEVLREIRSMYYSTPKPHKCKYDVAIHIRLGDLLLPDHEWKSESARFYAKKRIISLGRYKKLISLIKQKNPEFTICIYSQGPLEDFKELQQENVYFSLDTDLMTTFHEFVTAPRLVVAPSTLSRVAAIISEGKVLVFPHEFWMNPSCLGWKSIRDEYGEDV
tara:strand:+ start:462 stop:2246 length:1785 start_codon:yes stop_codon:yes gene_type:complete